MSKLRIGFVLTGSFCTFAKVMPVIQALIERGDTVTPHSPASPLSTALFLPSRLDRRRCLIY